MRVRVLARESMLAGGLGFTSLFLGAILSSFLAVAVAKHSPPIWLASLVGQTWVLLVLPVLCLALGRLQPAPRARVAWGAAVVGGVVLALLDWTVGFPDLWLEPLLASVRLGSLAIGGLLGARALRLSAHARA